MSTTQAPDERAIYEPTDVGALAPPAAPVAAPTPEPVAPPWSAGRKVAFRFAAVYFLLYLLPFPIGSLPIPGNPAQYWGKLEYWLAGLVETTIFGLEKPLPLIPTGSGDTMAQYASFVAWLIVATIVTVVWTIADRRRREYERLEQWVRTYVRFGLAVIMFSYGFAKIIPTQMPAPQLERLVQPWGEFSPMGVLWSFMGYSAVYQIFTGFGEALGGFLLLFRRTTTLGALVLCAVLANVVLLNYTFDVPVKLYSSHLLAMAVFLAAPDAKRLVNMLVLNRGAAPRPMMPLFRTARATRIAGVVAGAFIAWVCYNNLNFGWQYYRNSIGPDAPRSALYGIWNIDEVTKNSVVQPPLLSDSTRLKQVVFGDLNRVTFRYMSDSVVRYVMKPDSTKQEITLTARFDPKLVHSMSWVRPDSQHLVLNGVVNGDSLVVRLRRVDERKFLLVSRGYHWIQELPFNR